METLQGPGRKGGEKKSNNESGKGCGRLVLFFSRDEDGRRGVCSHGNISLDGSECVCGHLCARTDWALRLRRDEGGPRLLHSLETLEALKQPRIL